ncbi:hypothetical protein BaRGS_00029858 [Batillaria attramentaria]|uniref:Uncharacterized protein n=1 Tax=Batillaria attramentaria TaxID=370345 RepID=A0ABD0JW55_9CAEN
MGLSVATELCPLINRLYIVCIDDVRFSLPANCASLDVSAARPCGDVTGGMGAGLKRRTEGSNTAVATSVSKEKKQPYDHDWLLVE